MTLFPQILAQINKHLNYNFRQNQDSGLRLIFLKFTAIIT